jgi:hypothetical protein
MGFIFEYKFLDKRNGMDEISSVTMRRIVDALMREYLTRNGFNDTVDCFNKENPKGNDSISTRKELVEALYLSKESKQNKQRGLCFAFFLFNKIYH